MSVKLSELLEAATAELETAAYRNEVDGYEMTQEHTYTNALRAITPALVTAMKDAIERHIEVDDWQLCSACRLEHVLEEAGVTCE